MSTSSTPSARLLRADAEQNRTRIVSIARQAFADDSATTMQAIARAAGVGQGTLYRRFPTRESLLAEVYRDEFDGLLVTARRFLDEHEDEPVVALRRWFDVLASFGRMKHALADVLDAVTRSDLHDEQYDRILAVVDDLLRAGKDAGQIRPDIAPDEVFPLLSFLWHLEPQSDARTAHLLDLVVDSLRIR